MSLHNSTEKPNAQTLKRAAKEKRKNEDKRFAILSDKLKKLNEEGFEYEYSKDTQVTISGALFADFINSHEENRKVLDKLFHNNQQAAAVIDQLLNKNVALTLELMEIHLKNIELGILLKRKKSEGNEQ